MNLQDLTEYYPDERYQPIHPRLDECFKAIEVLKTQVENKKELLTIEVILRFIYRELKVREI